jgi:GNAT superfamily N-acetyltransferase
MKLEAMIPDHRGAAALELARELGLTPDQLVSEALALFFKAVLEVKRGHRLVALDPSTSRPVGELSTPTLSSLEWSLHPEKLALPPAALAKMHELSSAPPASGSRLLGTAKRPGSPYVTSRIEAEDAPSGFSCGKHPLDDYFARHASADDRAGISCAYVLRRTARHPPEMPRVLGFYTLGMALAESPLVAAMLETMLPRYPVPVVLISRLAVDARAQRRRVGELLLVDALRRALAAAGSAGCTGILADALDDGAAAFYAKYDFVTVSAEAWPHRMFLPIEAARSAFAEP